MISLAVEKRDVAATTLSALRAAGRIPAVVYGAHHATDSITVDAVSFAKVLKEAGEATIVSLTGLGAAIPTLIHAIDRDPKKGSPLHIDFYAVTKGEKVTIAIPLVFVGESEAVRGGANLVKVMREIEVAADPMNLPHEIEVDISSLVSVEDQIHAGSLALPAGVTLVTHAGEVVALIQEVTAEKEVAAADISSIEVEKKGKEETPAE